MSANAERLETDFAGFLAVLVFGLSLLAFAILPVSASAESPGVTTESADEVTTEGATLHGSVNPHGFATTYRFEYGTTTSYGTSVPVPDKSGGSGTTGVKVSETISGLQGNATYHFRIAAISSEGSSFGKDETFTTEVDPRFLSAFGSEGTGNGQFKAPRGIAIDAEGNIWVVDAGNNRVQKFNGSGEFMLKFGSEGKGNGQFIFPTDIAIDAEGNIWVTDTGNNRIQKFNAKGEYLSQFGSEGKGNGQFIFPTGIAIDAEGNIWVADTTNYRVQKFNFWGGYLTKFGSKGAGEGQFNSPHGIAIDSEGNAWVSDCVNDDLQKFNSEGEYLTKFGSSGVGDGQFTCPFGIATDAEDHVWVADKYNYRVQELDSSGEYLTQFGLYGKKAGQFMAPVGIAVSATHDVWVLDNALGLVQKWTPGPPSVATEAPDELTAEGAALHGTVNPYGLETSYRFEYGPTTSYGTDVPVPDKAIGSGTSNIKVKETIGGLKGNTTYHFRVVATNAEGTSFGKDETFTTK